jgi:hypothetical protein
MKYYFIYVGGSLGYLAGHFFSLKYTFNKKNSKKEYPILFGIIGTIIGGYFGNYCNVVINKTIDFIF